MPEPVISEAIYERDFWEGIIKSGDWKYFKDLLLAHKAYLEKQVLIYTQSRNFEKAFGYSERADECSKILTLVENRLSDLRTEKKGT